MKPEAHMNLFQYFLDNKDRPIHKNVHYFHVYERHFRPFVNRPVLMFEIGTGGGGSSQMWKRYFGPLACIVTVDINIECAMHGDEQVKVRIGDQTNLEFLSEIIGEFGKPDIVLDDGSHVMEHVTTTFRYLYPRMSHNGIYMVEDLHTAYLEGYGGGFRKPGTFIELCKDLIDEINADYTGGLLPPTQFSQQTSGMHIYDSMVVFERGRQPDKRSIVTGATQTY
jgi:cephalosporin hydroxylase